MHVTVAPDEVERVVEVPGVLSEALDLSPLAKAFFETLSYSNRKQYADWVSSAKREETRISRAGEAIAKLESGVKRLK